ncbi:MAG: DDE-type integrase/transposase/recombinase [Nanoarchaeota archaeon]|nr:DDE-type integrase/transposase/recombinase [Nanoarchaeota archaeon]
MQISKNTVMDWINYYTNLLYKFLQNRVPMSCNVLHMDELFLRMENKFCYLRDSICKDTKFSFWFLSKRRTKDNAKRLMRISAKPKKLVTDGSFSYIQPVKDVFGIPWFYKNYHRCETFEDKKHNNLVKRLQNTLRRYLHLRRGFYNTDTGNLFLQFLWIYYNFIRKHMTIRSTPAEKAGVICFANGIREYDRMLELIER